MRRCNYITTALLQNVLYLVDTRDDGSDRSYDRVGRWDDQVMIEEG